MTNSRIKHMVVFCLTYDKNSPEAEKFLQDSYNSLSSINEVEKFEVLRQISSKSNYDFGFSMEFANKAAYEKYNLHPTHTSYVEERWKKEVISFQEIDFEDIGFYR